MPPTLSEKKTNELEKIKMNYFSVPPVSNMKLKGHYHKALRFRLTLTLTCSPFRDNMALCKTCTACEFLSMQISIQLASSKHFCGVFWNPQGHSLYPFYKTYSSQNSIPFISFMFTRIGYRILSES